MCRLPVFDVCVCVSWEGRRLHWKVHKPQQVTVCLSRRGQSPLESGPPGLSTAE